ncbi:hypothetical protein HPP92_014855 [Vanilla planifolia]|uniref:Uncharacterized protein n=1 Tax=Vanilla planifolia TaxID=51239 RepID=A0A835QQX2_VANPL|nr:hypothetical protein HPP92_014855 [Vanilla planifolia]
MPKSMGGLTSQAAESESSSYAVASSEEDDEAIKAEKMIRPRSAVDKSVHLIPLLTLPCFLILYVCSRQTLPKVLWNAGGSSTLVDPIGEMLISVIPIVGSICCAFRMSY